MSPAIAPPLRTILLGSTVPNTHRPYFGSSSSIVWPPATNAPAACAVSAPPRKISPATSAPSSLSSASRFKATWGRAPIANTSESAFAAATRPNSYGSSTTGVKKSTVSTAAVVLLISHTAASSLVSNPRRSLSLSGKSIAGERQCSASSRSPGPHFAAQPPLLVSFVSATFSFSLMGNLLSSRIQYTSAVRDDGVLAFPPMPLRSFPPDVAGGRRRLFESPAISQLGRHRRGEFARIIPQG